MAVLHHGLLHVLQISRNYVRSDHLIVCSLMGAIWIAGNMGIAFTVRVSQTILRCSRRLTTYLKQIAPDHDEKTR
jgi:hypothetical protein